MREISAQDARRDFAALIARSWYGGERQIVKVRGQQAAAIVPLADLARLEESATAQAGSGDGTKP
jgi:prevent-host-death family protein